jgi:hypothetical protein
MSGCGNSGTRLNALDGLQPGGTLALSIFTAWTRFPLTLVIPTGYIQFSIAAYGRGNAPRTSGSGAPSGAEIK